MINEIKELLKECQITTYEITETKTIGWEFYFIKHALDQNRAKETVHTMLNVFQVSADGKKIGSASGECVQGLSKDQLKERILELKKRASLVENPFYELNQPADFVDETPSFDVQKIAQDYITCMQEIPETKTEDINSYEIFVNEIQIHFMNSNGIDTTYRFPSSMMEVIINARNESHEIELYRDFKSGTCDAQNMKEQIIQALTYGKDRLQTVPTPKMKTADVLFSTQDSCAIYEYFLQRIHTSSIYQKLSNSTIGSSFCDKGQGDTITVQGVKQLPNSSCNAPVDCEGALIKDAMLIEKNVVKKYWGPRSFAQYLKIEDSCIYNNFSFQPGNSDEATLRKKDYLEIVEFSDFQVDAMSGNIAGEIRLGYYHHDGEVLIVSGGSISGNMKDCIPTMQMSKEQIQYNHFNIPKITVLHGLKVTGIQ